MSLKEKIKRSRFALSCIFFAGYAAYAVYAAYYYRTFRNALSIALLALIAATFALTATVTFVSYRINLKNKPRPRLHRFIKIAKYISQLLSSAVTIGLLVTAVRNTNAFSLVIAVITIPFLLIGLFVNVLAEYFERRYPNGAQTLRRIVRKGKFFRPPRKIFDKKRDDVYNKSTAQAEK